MKPASGSADIYLRNDLRELERLRVAVEAFGANYCLPGPLLFELNLALEEWVTNIVAYGYDDTGPHSIAVRISLDTTAEGRHVAIEVEDDARPFNPLEVPPPRLDLPIEERPVGGLGIHFLRRCMDSVAYERVGTRNRLLLRKQVVG